LLDAQLQLKAAQTDLMNVKAKLDSDLMTQKAGAATVSADYNQAKLQAQTDKSLYDLGRDQRADIQRLQGQGR